MLNPNSALRHNWREWRKVFDVIAVMAGHVEGQTNDRVDIICLLKFRKSLTDEALTVRVIVPLTFKKDDKKLVHQEKLTIAKDG